MKSTLKMRLDEEVSERNSLNELSIHASPDPLMVVHAHPDEYSALVCALLSYGNARAIVDYLRGLDFSLLDAENEDEILNKTFAPYRFQKPFDIQALFIALNRLKKRTSLNAIFLKGYTPNRNVAQGVLYLQKAIYDSFTCKTKGYQFLVGKVANQPQSPMKRWMMYLRWMVRKDALDLGLWDGIDTKDLLMPLDTHTQKVALALGLLKRKTYDYKAVLELTNSLRSFDMKDPVKYDFALFRLGQEDLINQMDGLKFI
jgi:uncharacterized protein (TIGR02757 family)